jgi:hypothetical protein
MPKGRFSSVPGFGIHTRLVGLTFEPSFRLLISFKRAAGDKDFNPSTPAVFLPVLSWVTLRTDKALADQDFISVFWSLRTAFTSPRLEAW